MKVLVLSNMYPSKKYPFYGTFVYNFVKNLELNGINTKAITINKSKNIIIKIYSYIAYSLSALCHLAPRNKYDIIYVHFPTYSAIPLLLLPLRNRKIVLNFHGEDLFPKSSLAKILYNLTKHLIKKSCLVVVPSDYFKNTISKRHLIPSSKIFVSPSGGVDRKKFQFANKKISNVLNIGFLSRIDTRKGWDTFVQSLHALNQKEIAYHAYIGGTGKEYPKLKAMIKMYNLENKVTLQGAISHERVPDFFKNINLFLFLSSREAESLGLVAIESLACGVPVLAIKNGAVDEFLKNDYNGYVIENPTPKNISKKIQEHYSLSAAQRERMASNSIKSIEPYDSVEISKMLIIKLSTL